MDFERLGRGRRRIRGGIKGTAAIRAAAVLSALGLDGMRFLDSGDPAEILVMQTLAEETRDVLSARDKALAAEIANAVGRLFRR